MLLNGELEIPNPNQAIRPKLSNFGDSKEHDSLGILEKKEEWKEVQVDPPGTQMV